MKNLVIFTRNVLERRQLGYFQQRKEFEILQDYTPKKKEEFIKQINKNKKVPFEIMAEYDFKKVKDKDRFLLDIVKFKNIDFYKKFYNYINDIDKDF